MSDFVKVARLEDIPVGSVKPFDLKQQKFIVARTDSGVFALVNECTHDGAPISDGKLKGDGEIMCRRHGARFDLKSGNVTAPPALVPIDTLEVEIEGEDILVRLED